MTNNLHLLSLSSSEEDYLLAIARNPGPVKTGELARRLTVADASVTAMVAKLEGKGLVRRMSHKPISLTGSGREVAMHLLRRHRLIELFLTNTLGYTWNEVHAEAHKLEHMVSDKFIERLDIFLGRPELDPHGSPIPQRDGSLPSVSRTPINNLGVGQSASIAEVSDCDEELLDYAGKLGLTPGRKITLIDKEPYDGLLTLRVSNRKITIGRAASVAILVDGSTIEDSISK